MNTQKSKLFAIIMLAVFAISAAAIPLAHALPFQSGNLYNPSTLTIVGSSTVLPIANSEAGPFQAKWNSLVTANPTWGASSCTQAIVPVGQGSGTAIPGLTGGTADIGEMSRPPQNSAAEWLAPSMTNMQTWAIGVDSVAIVVSPDMSWFPTSLTTSQVAQLFADNNPTANLQTGTVANYTTWGQFLADYYGGSANIPSSVPAAALTENILRAVRDPTSGTFDCFNNYFAVPNNLQFQHKTGGVADTSENMAPFTYCQENVDIQNHVSAGNLASQTDYIGFISLGYYQSLGHMIGLNIAFNIANPPASTITASTTPTWGPYVTPNKPNVLWAIGGVKGAAATGQYWAWRWLWEVTPGQIPASGQLLETGVWIAYMRAYNTTSSGASDFVNDNNYIELSQADMAGGHPIDSTLANYSPLAGQTQTIPDGKVSFGDIVYFVSGYLNYYGNNVYNPYCDINADGKITFGDIVSFVNAYLQYFISYNP